MEPVDFDKLLIEAKQQKLASSTLLGSKQIRRGVVELDEATKALADESTRVFRGADESLRLLSGKKFDPDVLSREIFALSESIQVSTIINLSFLI